MCDMPREGAQFRLGAGRLMPPGAAEDLMGKINGAMPQRKPPKGAKMMDPKRITAPVVASAFAQAEAELDDLEAQYARQAAQLREAASTLVATSATSPTPAIISELPVPDQNTSANEASLKLTAVITSATQDGVQFYAKVPKLK